MKNYSYFFIAIGFVILCYFLFSTKPTQHIHQNSLNVEHYVDNKPKVSTKLRLGDRVYIASVLSDTFGPSSNKTIDHFILQKPAVFGGGCDWYQQVRIGPKPRDFADVSKICPLGKFSLNAATIGDSNVLRQAYIAKTCNILTNNSTTIQFVLNQINSDGNQTAINDQNIQTAYNLFYNEQVAPAEIVNTLKTLAHGSTLDSWKKIIYTLCADSRWQII